MNPDFGRPEFGWLLYLILHPGLDQVDGVNGRSTSGTSNATQQETISRLKNLDDYATIFGTLEVEKNGTFNIKIKFCCVLKQPSLLVPS